MIKRLMLASSAVAMSVSGAFAQTVESGIEQDEVVVTGSRIPQDPNLVSNVPIQSIDRDDFLLSGELNLADVVNDIPALVASTTSENSDTGANALNLRGLGTARSLTLVNGRRHVAGFRGSSAVDVSSIPQALVERVEVTTGGASAIYGADAVTGVVNFILKDDFEGADINLRGGISSEWDAENFDVSGVFGKNFDNDRGNVTFTAAYTGDTVLRRGDRDFTSIENFEVAVANPALRFQSGDITNGTPSLAQFYGFDGISPIGIGTIPSEADFIQAYTDRFGTAPSLNARERAILARSGAPQRALVPDFTFWLSSQQGSIIPGDFGGFASPDLYFVDVNNNGVTDCLETITGQQISNFLAGCWVVDDNGQVRLFNDGLFFDGARGSGGDGARQAFNEDYTIPKTAQYDFNVNARYDLTASTTAFVEAKYVSSETETFNDYDNYYDTLLVGPDNPFIPGVLQQVANDSGGLRVTQDARGWAQNDISTFERETMRFVGGLRGEFANGMNWELSANYGEFTRTDEFDFALRDRYFAAIDATVDANGNAVCRSELDPTAVPNNDEYFSTYSLDDPYVPGFYTFTPGVGECAPLNIFGTNNVSDAARAFINERVQDEIRLTQTVFSGIVSGEFEQFGSGWLDAPLGYAAGVEYREETSRSTLNGFDLGIVPEGSPLQAGAQIGTLVEGMNSFNFDNNLPANTRGSYDVAEVFGEVRLPILMNRRHAKELTLDGAIRYADYSTSGGNESWKVGGTWAPDDNLSIRTTYSRAVRAPNISELFDPLLPITVSSDQEPCTVGNIAASIDPAAREAACVADLRAIGVPDFEQTGPGAPTVFLFDEDGNYAFRNPLTARFSGVSGGNPELVQETANTFTIGGILQPSFIDNLTITVDYWDIEIDDAIGNVSNGDIFSGCYDRAIESYCDLFRRNTNTDANTFAGLVFLESSPLNFARVEADGIDFTANYFFDVGEFRLGANLVGSRQFALDRFFNPFDLTDVDPELEEIQRPKTSGNLTLSAETGPLYVGLQTTYQSRQAYAEVETIEANWQDTGFTNDIYVFDLNARYEMPNGLTVYGGVNNLTDEDPFRAQLAWPVSPRGRFLFAGVNARF